MTNGRARVTTEVREAQPSVERLVLRLLDDAQDMVYRYRIKPPRGTEFIAGAVQAITGHTAAEFYADPDLGCKSVHPDDVVGLWTSADEPTATPHATIRWVHADGRIVRAEHRRVMIHDPVSGDLVAIEGIARDVTELVEAQEQLHASQRQLRSLAASLQTAREEERTALARELHDELGQTLTALKLELVRMADLLRDVRLKPGAVNRLQSLAGLVDIGLTMVRRIATTLRPPALDHLGVAEAIRGEAAAFRARTGLRCRVAVDKEPTALTGKQQTALFRIFQEALTNVARHAKASAVRVQLTEHRDAFELRVQDNGRGITRAEIADPGSIGLLGMQERAAQVGAVLDIAGVSGKGSVVTVCVPLPSSTTRPRLRRTPRKKARRTR